MATRDIFLVYNLTHSPQTAALYYKNAWNKLSKIAEM